MSRTVRFHSTGGPEVLQIDEVPAGDPGTGEVRIRVHAIGLNRAEAMFRSGAYLEEPVPPAKLGAEAAGVIEAVGPGVTGFVEGDAVSTIPLFSMTQYGVYGETAIVPAQALVKRPATLSWTEAAAIWMQYLTAYGALIQVGGLKAQEEVVITAASSSVGLAAIQIAKSVGAISIATTRSRGKREALLKAGATHVVVTDEQDLPAEIMRITANKGAQMVFDPIGGPGVETLVAGLANEGTLFLYGALDQAPTPFPLFPAIFKNVNVRGYRLGLVTDDPVNLERGKQFVLEGIATGRLKPIIDRSFAFDDIIEAHRYLESNQQVGKIVVTV